MQILQNKSRFISCTKPRYEISSPERTLRLYGGFCDLNQMKSKSWSLIGDNDNPFLSLEPKLVTGTEFSL